MFRASGLQLDQPRNQAHNLKHGYLLSLVPVQGRAPCQRLRPRCIPFRTCPCTEATKTRLTPLRRRHLNHGPVSHGGSRLVCGGVPSGISFCVALLRSLFFLVIPVLPSNPSARSISDCWGACGQGLLVIWWFLSIYPCRRASIFADVSTQGNGSGRLTPPALNPRDEQARRRLADGQTVQMRPKTRQVPNAFHTTVTITLSLPMVDP